MRAMLAACLILAAGTVWAADGDIAVAAKITASPATEPNSPGALVDGRLDTQLTFAVGTAGEGTITFAFDHPRLAKAVRLYQSHAVYYSTAYVIEADTDGDGNFEKPLAEAKPAVQGEWVEHTFAPLRVQALRFRSTAGVSQGNRAHPCPAEMHIIGELEAGDMDKAAELGIVMPRVPAVRPLTRETPLVVKGRGPAVLAPAGPEHEAAKQALLKALAPYQPEAVADLAAADPGTRTVICLGSMVTNPLIERLYWNRYALIIDALAPGPGSFLIHTVYDPYPWNGGNNVVVIGCSDAAGALPAVQAFAGLIKDGKLPYIVQGGPKPLVSADEAAKVAAAKVNPTFEDVLTFSTGYLKTGCEAYAQQAVEALKTMMTGLYAEGGQRRDPKTDRHTVLPWNEETQSFTINCAWDAFEECPLISDELRLDATNAYLQFTRDLVGNVSDWSGLDEKTGPQWNHTTFPLLGVYGGARYFQRYYKLADMAEKLQKAKWSFTAQARSWKPQEDSDAYLPLVPDHVITYALAENELGYLTSGNLQKYADYVVGVLDNRGLGSGFGDSGFSSRPSQAEEALPLALWWTKDRGYKWLLDQYTAGNWRDPFERGLKPERPDRFTGLNVFMLDPQIYEYTQTSPTYNEPFKPSDVAAEAAFDKVSFRDGWDLDAQYLLLDGLGRGKHLHFDTNAIVEFVEGGERWLLDHDYLTRNTTEHSMLTVLRDGRGNELVPSLAALEAHADLPGLGYTDSVVRDDNGCDWRRQVLWQRGESFLVADSVTARQPGDYDLELTWKTIDSAGEQRVVNGRDLVAERGAGSAKTQNCLVVDDPEASGGRALLMEQGSSRVAFGADLPPGDYRLKVIGYGMDGSSDSLWVSVNLQPNVAFHMPKLKYASSTGDAANTAETPTVTLKGKVPHLFIVTLRENPSIRLDRFVFVDAAGKETTYEAEALPPAPRPTTDLSRYFHIKTVSPLQAFVTNHERQGISVPISLYHQRQARKLQVGQTVRFCSLMYTSLPAKRRDLAPVEVAENLVAIQGTSPALAVLGPVAATGLTANAGAGLIGADSLALAGMTKLQLGELQMQASQPVNVQLDLKSGQGTVAAAVPTKLTVGTQSFTCAAGKQPITVKLPALTKARQAIGALLKTRPAATATAAATAAAADAPAWSAFGTDADITVIKTADLQIGSGPCVFVGRGPILHCLDATGKQLWQSQMGGKVKDLACADLRPEPGLEVLVGSADTYAYIVSATGRILDKHQMRGTPWARSFGDAAYKLYNVGVWDVNGDGQPEIVVTMSNFDLQVMDRNWNLLFKKDWALHGSMQLSFEAAGGKPGTLFVGDKYGSVIGISGAGKSVFRSYTSIGDVFYGVGDLLGDGKVAVINASSTGDTMASDLATGKELWRFDNFGYPTNRVQVADLNGDGKQEVLLASGAGYLYVLDGAGKVLWQDRIGVGVNDVLVLGQGAQSRVVYADESGLVRMTDGAGKLVKEWHTEAPPRLLARCRNGVAVALANGRVVGLVW